MEVRPPSWRSNLQQHTMKTILIAGLGNPGKEYAKTRHNAGFMFVDYFWEKFRDKFGFSDWKLDKKLKSEISVGKKDQEKIILLKPQTFMNLSGEAIKKTLDYFKIDIADLKIIHDDIDLSLGKMKINLGASSAGHNGVQDIIEKLGTKDFTRIRFGIENRGEIKIETDKYVLEKFTTTEEKILNKIIDDTAAEI
jgi:peptidyl-tRNA hydrolase, PTH1 family